jgi:hypothetical protein
MIDSEELVRRTLRRFTRVHDEVFRGDPAANDAIEVEVTGSALAEDTPVLILITPWTLNGLAFPPDDRFPSSLIVNKQRYPVFAHELDDLGRYQSVNLVPDVSDLTSQEDARRIASELAAPFHEAVSRLRQAAEVPNPSRRGILGFSDRSSGFSEDSDVDRP